MSESNSMSPCLTLFLTVWGTPYFKLYKVHREDVLYNLESLATAMVVLSALISERFLHMFESSYLQAYYELVVHSHIHELWRIFAIKEWSSRRIFSRSSVLVRTQTTISLSKPRFSFSNSSGKVKNPQAGIKLSHEYHILSLTSTISTSQIDTS